MFFILSKLVIFCFLFQVHILPKFKYQGPFWSVSRMNTSTFDEQLFIANY